MTLVDQLIGSNRRGESDRNELIGITYDYKKRMVLYVVAYGSAFPFFIAPFNAPFWILGLTYRKCCCGCGFGPRRVNKPCTLQIVSWGLHTIMSTTLMMAQQQHQQMKKKVRKLFNISQICQKFLPFFLINPRPIVKASCD